MLPPLTTKGNLMAKKKVEEPEEQVEAAESVEEKPRKPKIVESPSMITVTQQEPDKNGASVTIVEGRTYEPNNSAVEIHVGERVYNGGTTINGEFRAFIPSTDEPITVVINGETIA